MRRALLCVRRLGVLCSALLLAACTDTGFSQSQALFVVIENEKYGYIDTEGQSVINPQFDDAWSFSEGLARVKVADKFGFIDREGLYVINPQFDDARDFSEGLAAVEVGEVGGRWTYIDREGQ